MLISIRRDAAHNEDLVPTAAPSVSAEPDPVRPALSLSRASDGPIYPGSVGLQQNLSQYHLLFVTEPGRFSEAV